MVLVHTELHALVFLHICVHAANCPGYPNDTMAVSVTAETVRLAVWPGQWVLYLIDWVQALNTDEHTYLSRLKVGQLSLILLLFPPLFLLLFIFYSMKNNFHGLVTRSRLIIYHDKDEAFSLSSSEFLIYHRFTVQCFHTSAALCVTAWLPVFHLTFTDGKHAPPGGNNPYMHAIIQTLSHQHQFSSRFLKG